jgi:hypothetical protein
MNVFHSFVALIQLSEPLSPQSHMSCGDTIRFNLHSMESGPQIGRMESENGVQTCDIALGFSFSEDKQRQ